MAEESYDIGICNKLKERFSLQQLHRPMRIGRYDAGQRLTYDMTGIASPAGAKVDLEIIKFVGGGFAGQVYKVKVLDIQGETIPGLTTGGEYAVKILIPPSGFARFFRNIMYYIGFQGPFQLQVNPTASRAGALWQKLIRRGAKVRFNDESMVNDIHATFVDSTLGSCGEISDWVDGRTWRLEVDDRMDLLKRFKRRKKVKKEHLGSPEYRAKKKFMTEFVSLLQDMGAYEFARQYEWTTCKSQPNCLKRNNTNDDPEKGLIAVDFRAGLALLPLLPMSPGDFKLILKGLMRGSLVQFDRGKIKKLEAFMNVHPDEFKDCFPMLEQLKQCEEVYRNSLPDITHNHFRLLFSKKLWSTIFESARVGWRVKNTITPAKEEKLRKNAFKTFLFYILGIIPFLGPFIRKLWGRPDWRRHYGHLLTRISYFRRSAKAKCAEKAIFWHRSGRVTKEKAEKIGGSFGRYLAHVPLSILPVGLHRIFTNKLYFKERMYYIFVRPFKLYFSNSMREEWLRDMVAQGRKKHILSERDAGIIESQIKEPFIQKYLKCLAVHVLTLPVTQIVSIIVSWIYVQAHPELTSPEAFAAVGAILVLFQITPISPGSLVRGLYVVYMMIKDRSFKDYNIAVFLGFFKYIGYLAFPIQMAYRYPELARFMAGHWATEAVHVVPVFGEGGALLEHWIFGIFYNWPLTIRRRMQSWKDYRETLKSRYWHMPLYAVLAAALLTGSDYLYRHYTAVTPTLGDTWWLITLAVIFFSALVTMGCGGAVLSKRIMTASFWGILLALIYTAARAYFIFNNTMPLGDVLTDAAWYLFIVTFLAAVTAVVTELRRKDPRLKQYI